jgi:hypothetical protein
MKVATIFHQYLAKIHIDGIIYLCSFYFYVNKGDKGLWV